MSLAAAPIPFARSMLSEHRHVCAFFSSAKEEYDKLLPFICDGLNCGQRAFHVLPAQHKDEHLQQIRSAGIAVEAAQRSRRLEVALPEDTYLRTGRFNKDAMLALIQEALKDGTALGFPLIRMIVHAETAVDDWKSGNEWVEHEMRLNDVLPNYDDPVICTYDVNLLTAGLAIDILRTHPVAIIGGSLVEKRVLHATRGFPARSARPYGAAAGLSGMAKRTLVCDSSSDATARRSG
jgi:MEDS: MEthanogen/methylotroph, DcmR Sensory domain